MAMPGGRPGAALFSLSLVCAAAAAPSASIPAAHTLIIRTMSSSRQPSKFKGREPGALRRKQVAREHESLRNATGGPPAAGVGEGVDSVSFGRRSRRLNHDQQAGPALESHALLSVHQHGTVRTFRHRGKDAHVRRVKRAFAVDGEPALAIEPAFDLLLRKLRSEALARRRVGGWHN